jgi:hypothetical protein
MLFCRLTARQYTSAMNSDDRTHAGQGSLTVWLSGAVMLIALYVLSVGPAYWLCNNPHISPWWQQWISLPYFPLAWLRDNCEPFADALNWYLKWWH